MANEDLYRRVGRMENSVIKVETKLDSIEGDVVEIKQESKETNKFFREVISELKENTIRQTEILNRHSEQFNQVNEEIAELKEDLDSNTQWYQDFLSNNFGWVIKILVFLLMLLGGAKLTGVPVEKLFGN